MKDVVLDKVISPTDRYVGSRVRAQRLSVGITQEKLGAALGITFQQVQKYEKGLNRIGASRLQQIARTLGVEASVFFDAPVVSQSLDQGGDARLVVDFLATAEGVQLSRAFLRIQNRGIRRSIVDLVEEFADRQ